MILLDTDHISILKYSEHPRTVRLNEALEAAAANDVVAATIISAEKQVSGWLARIRRETIVHRQVGHYRQLKQLFDFYDAWCVEPFDDSAADVFLDLRRRQLRLGTRDMKIAAIALSRGALLLSANLRDFEKVPGLRVENWVA